MVETNTIRKALIPLAGLSTRMRPLSGVVPKALFPLVDGGGRVRALVHYICAEVLAAGIERICLVVSAEQEPILRDYFAAARRAGDRDVPESVEYVHAEPRGFGYAVARGAEFLAGEPFLVMLGDHVHLPEAGHPACTAQVVGAFAERGGSAMIGMQTIGPDELSLVGVARGEPIAERVFRCTHLVEKPDRKLARRALRTPGLGDDQYLAHAGIYAFTAEILECLDELAGNLPEGKELGLTEAQQLLLQRHAGEYYLYHIAGRALDAGSPAAYAATLRTMMGE